MWLARRPGTGRLARLDPRAYSPRPRREQRPRPYGRNPRQRLFGRRVLAKVPIHEGAERALRLTYRHVRERSPANRDYVARPVAGMIAAAILLPLAVSVALVLWTCAPATADRPPFRLSTVVRVALRALFALVGILGAWLAW